MVVVVRKEHAVNALLMVLSSESVRTTAAQGRGPLVVTLAVLLVLLLLTQSVRVVAPDDRLVVRRRGAQRVAGPGLVLLAPGLDEARTISVAPVERRVVAPGALTGRGARALLVLRVGYRVTDPAVHRSDEAAFRAVALATRRAVRRLTDAESAGAQIRVDRTAWLSERISAELEGLGFRLDEVAVEDVRLAPRPAEDLVAAPAL